MCVHTAASTATVTEVVTAAMLSLHVMESSSWVECGWFGVLRSKSEAAGG